MAYYRYSASYPDDKKEEHILHSIQPFELEKENGSRFCHRYYTSEQDDCPHLYIHSLGHEVRWPPKTKPPRMIGRYVLTYITDGEGSFNGEPIKHGDFCFSTPYDGHIIREKPHAPLEYYYISIGGINASSFFQDLGLFSISLTQKCSFINQIPAVFNDMLYTEHPDKDTEIYLIGAFLQLISMHKKELVNYTQRSESESFRQYKEALLYIQDHLLKGITPIDVAHYLHISPSYLRAIFAKHCKYTLRELLIRQRLECAAKRLIYDDSSVAQAANFVGYTNYTLFSSIFKKYIGYSPQEYKKLHRNVNDSPKN